MKNDDPYHWYLASYPRSGNTWCRIFISEIFRIKKHNVNKEFNLNIGFKTGSIISDRNWLDDQLGICSSDLDFKELDHLRNKIEIQNKYSPNKLRFHKVHDSYFIKGSTCKSVISKVNCKGIVYIVRNPFDIAISLSNFFSWDITTAIEFLLSNESELCGSKKNGEIQCRQYLGNWENHFLSWTNQSELPLLILKYEDLSREPIKYFTKLANFLEIEFDNDLIEQVTSNIQFIKLREKEDHEGFIENCNNKKKFFYSGKVGTGLKQLKDCQIAQLKESFKDTLIKLSYI
tara:strand:+ start:58 stop:924 length:867 start_codon:yes stop_codon:yes gene_type:complete